MWRERADGLGRRYVSVSGEPVFDARGRFAGYRGLTRDVTEQKRGEALLRLQHTVTRHFAEAADAAQGAIGALRAICEAEGWDCGQFWRVDAADRRGAALCLLGDAGRQGGAGLCRSLARESACARTGADRRGMGVRRAAVDRRTLPRIRARSARRSREQTGLRGALLCPVPAGGRTVGVLSFVCRNIRPPDDALTNALASVATQLGPLPAPRRCRSGSQAERGALPAHLRARGGGCGAHRPRSALRAREPAILRDPRLLRAGAHRDHRARHLAPGRQGRPERAAPAPLCRRDRGGARREALPAQGRQRGVGRLHPCRGARRRRQAAVRDRGVRRHQRAPGDRGCAAQQRGALSAGGRLGERGRPRI